mmetsp:Transcript_4241/g.15645  ORF Transcript_4241/g.15645 Transcript_4241/m.15645 type:complete len:252 (-) Transcript_4241:5-760(-)
MSIKPGTLPSALPAFRLMNPITAGANSTLVRSISKSNTFDGTRLRIRKETRKPKTATTPEIVFSTAGVPLSSSINTSARAAEPVPNKHISGSNGFSNTMTVPELFVVRTRYCARASAASQFTVTKIVKNTRWSKCFQNGRNSRSALVNRKLAMASFSSDLAIDSSAVGFRRLSFRRAAVAFANRALAFSASELGNTKYVKPVKSREVLPTVATVTTTVRAANGRSAKSAAAFASVSGDDFMTSARRGVGDA